MGAITRFPQFDNFLPQFFNIFSLSQLYLNPWLIFRAPEPVKTRQEKGK